MRRREFLLSGAALLASRSATAAEYLLRQAARDAFIYTLPMVEIASVRTQAMARGLKPGQFASRKSLATPQTRSVTTPNNDTINAEAFIDLSNGPASLTVPRLGGRRYASLALIDMFSDNFAVLSTRTIGDDGGDFLLVGPTDRAPIDAIRSPTPWVWAVARVLVDGPPDIDRARGVLAGFKCKFAQGESPAPGVARDAAWSNYLSAANNLLLENPPPVTDRAILERMAALGLGSAQFDPARFDATAASEIAAGLDDARASVKSRVAGKIEGGWAYELPDTGNFFQDYETRARIAVGGLGALPPAEAMYLAALNSVGRRLFDGDGLWRLSFAKGLTPPVDAFWSLTMYDATPQGHYFLTPNAIGRYSIGDRTPGLAFDLDGSLDLWISRTDPGDARSSNWLPAPKNGPFSMILRAYLPKREMQFHGYVPPPVSKV